MPTLVFHGTIFPEGLQITSDPAAINWRSRETGETGSFRATIKDSRIEVACDVAEGFDLAEIFIQASDFAKAIVNVIAFQRAIGVQVVIDRYVQDGVTALMLPKNEVLEGLCKSFGLGAGQGLGEVRKMVVEEPKLAACLDDLISAIAVPHYSPIACGRVIEGIRHLIAPGEEDRAVAWDRMRNALNVDVSYLTYVTGISREPRHGNPVRVEGKDTQEIPRSEFSLLSG